MLLIIDKPSGFTSFDLIRKIQKFYPKKTKIGHAGTLDPLATGVMLIAIGKDTKKLGQLTGMDKTYTATIDFTRLTDTWDYDEWKRGCSLEKQGEVYSLPKEQCNDAIKRGYEHLTNQTVVVPSKEELNTICTSLMGTHDIALTPFSAKKREGTKLYEHARAGDPIHSVIPMSVRSFTIDEYAFPYATITFTVASGTYIRSLAYHIGKHLGLGGALTALRRTSVGPYSL